MPDFNEYKKNLNAILGMKDKSEFSEEDLKFYDEMNKEYTGRDWKAKLDQRKKENAEILEGLNKVQETLKKDFLDHLPEYRLRKEAELLEKKAEYEKEAEKLLRRIKSDETMSKEQRDELIDLRAACNRRAENMASLAEFARNGNGYRSITGAGSVITSYPDDPVYETNKQTIRKLEAENQNLEKYEKMRNALGRDVSDLAYDNVKKAVDKYNEAKNNINSLSGWQKFWGKILPASWYKPAEQYAEMNAYAEALSEANIAAEAVNTVDQETDSVSRQAFDGEESEKLINDIDLDKSNEIEDEVAEYGKENELGVNK